MIFNITIKRVTDVTYSLEAQDEETAKVMWDIYSETYQSDIDYALSNAHYYEEDTTIMADYEEWGDDITETAKSLYEAYKED